MADGEGGSGEELFKLIDALVVLADAKERGYIARDARAVERAKQTIADRYPAAIQYFTGD